MKFLKQPCGDCPFRLDMTYHLHPERAQQIGDALAHDGYFQCHKEVDRVRREALALWQQEHGEDAEAEDTELDELATLQACEDRVEPAAFCGGAIRYMDHNDMLHRNMMTRWAIRTGALPFPLPAPIAPCTSDIQHLSRGRRSR